MNEPESEEYFEKLRKSLGDVVRATREARGLSLRQLAATSGVSKQTIHQIEEGQGGSTGPGIWLLCRIGGALGVDLAGQVLRQSRMMGLGVVNREGIEVIQNAKQKSDLEAIRWPVHYRFGFLFEPGDEFVTRDEFLEIEATCNRKIVDILSRNGPK